MFDWKQTIADAKELLDMGAITQDQFEQVRTEALAKRTESTSPPSTLPKLNDMGTRIHTEGAFPDKPSSDIGNMGTMVVVSNSTPPSSLEHFGTMVGKMGGNTIGSYRILHLLGEGGMGSVYKGRHKNEQVAEARGDVAIKMIHPSLAKDEDFKTRFVKEGLFGMSLQHPNIAKVTEVIDEQGLLAVVMEYIEGQELKDMIPTNGMSVDEVIRLLKPIALALDHLHEKGIVHRDMKPANVRIKPDGTPVILDFGIAKDTNEADSGMTQTGTAMGTQTYMAPEQMDAKRVTGAADQYALAMMAYQMLSGQFPWDESLSSARVTMAKITGVLDIVESKIECSSSVNEVIMKGLSLDAGHRFKTCTTFISRLKNTVESQPNENESVDEIYTQSVSSDPNIQTDAVSRLGLQKEIHSDNQQGSSHQNLRVSSPDVQTTSSEVAIQSITDHNQSQSTKEVEVGQETKANPMPKVILGLSLGLGLFAVGMLLSSDAEQVQSTSSINNPEQTTFTVLDAEGVARQWNDSLNDHDVEAYANLISDVVWYYPTPLLKNTVIQRKASAFQKDPNYTQSIMNVQISERQNGLFHISFMKDSTYKGKQLTIESYLWVKDVNGKLLIVRESDSSSLKISTKKSDPSMSVSIGDYDGAGSKDMLLSYPSSSETDGSYTYSWWLFTDNDVAHGQTIDSSNLGSPVYVESSLAVSHLVAPVFVLEQPTTMSRSCKDVTVFGFVTADQHHSKREELFHGEICDKKYTKDAFYKKQGALYVNFKDGDVRIFPK